eukprot:scaffold187619_cov33-Tisochrysis_lutea.AAC.2
MARSTSPTMTPDLKAAPSGSTCRTTTPSSRLPQLARVMPNEPLSQSMRTMCVPTLCGTPGASWPRSRSIDSPEWAGDEVTESGAEPVRRGLAMRHGTA